MTSIVNMVAVYEWQVLIICSEMKIKRDADLKIWTKALLFQYER